MIKVYLDGDGNCVIRTTNRKKYGPPFTDYLAVMRRCGHICPYKTGRAFDPKDTGPGSRAFNQNCCDCRPLDVTIITIKCLECRYHKSTQDGIL